MEEEKGSAEQGGLGIEIGYVRRKNKWGIGDSGKGAVADKYKITCSSIT